MSDRTLRLLLAFDDRVQREREQSPAVLHRRDRRFALDCEQQGCRPDPARWLAHVAGLGRIGGAPPQQQADDPLRPWYRLQLVLFTAGTVLGALCLYGVLVYEGTQRINLTLLLALVALQLALALLTALQSFLGWQPWQPLKARFLRSPAPSALAPLQPMLLGRGAQLGGLGFGLGGLAVLLVMVVLQDLAFGWSTTLATGADTFYGLVAALSAPWGSVWPAAVPDLELVEATRFYRIQAVPSSGAPAAQRWGQWWPFVVALWTTYVILPRALLALLAHTLLTLRARATLRLHPGLQALQARMHTPVVETAAELGDARLTGAEEEGEALVPLPAQAALLCWAGASRSALPADLEVLGAEPLRVGGSASLAEDTAAIEFAAQRLREVNPAARSVIVLVRAWEPPTGELGDFLRQAQSVWPEGSVVVLALESLSSEPPPPHLQAQWRHFAARWDAGEGRPLLALAAGSPAGEARPDEGGAA